MKSIAKKILYGVSAVILTLVILAVAGIAYLSLTEYSPSAVEQAGIIQTPNPQKIKSNAELTFISYNIGYAGLGENQDFFMDGGNMVRPQNVEDVKENLTGIESELQKLPADFYLLQEIDENSHRSYNLNQTAYLSKSMDLGYSFTYNFKCNYVPYPFPPIGGVASGLMTMTTYPMLDSQRLGLPVPFSWPVRLANLKRCLLVNRYKIENSAKQLVVVNLHLEAYDDGEGKAMQSQKLWSILNEEYKKGNYVIAGGDWNQVLPGAPTPAIQDPNFWQPPVLDTQNIDKDWTFAVDKNKPTNRLNNIILHGNKDKAQYYSLDGFLISPNVELKLVEAIDTGFKNSDHLPLRLDVKLK